MTNTPEHQTTTPFSDALDELEDEPSYQPGGAYGPLVLLADLNNWRAMLAAATERTVQKARAAGRTWEDIGDVLGVTKQAAQQRYGAGQ